MRKNRVLPALVSLSLIGAGIAFVPPYTEQRIEQAWAPVLGNLQRLSPESGEWVDLEPGAHVVFLEGPAQDPLFADPRLEGAWVEIVDPQGGRTLSQETDVDYEHTDGDRRLQALTKVRTRRGDGFRLNMTGPDLEPRGFKVAFLAAGTVEDQSREATFWRVGKWAAFAGIALVVLMLFANKD